MHVWKGKCTVQGLARPAALDWCSCRWGRRGRKPPCPQRHISPGRPSCRQGTWPARRGDPGRAPSCTARRPGGPCTRPSLRASSLSQSGSPTTQVLWAWSLLMHSCPWFPLHLCETEPIVSSPWVGRWSCSQWESWLRRWRNERAGQLGSSSGHTSCAASAGIHSCSFVGSHMPVACNAGPTTLILPSSAAPPVSLQQPSMAPQSQVASGAMAAAGVQALFAATDSLQCLFDVTAPLDEKTCLCGRNRISSGLCHLQEGQSPTAVLRSAP